MSTIRRKRRGVRAAAIVASVLTIAACSSSGSSGEPKPRRIDHETDWIVGQPYSFVIAIQAVETERSGIVLIDSLSEVDGGNAVEARWYEDGQVVTVIDDERPAIFAPRAWARRDQVHVAGYRCSEPDLHGTVAQGPCGSDAYELVIRRLDLATRGWSEVAATIPTSEWQFEAPLIVAGETHVLLRGDAGEPGSAPVTYEVDLATGATTTLDLPDGELQLCASGRDYFGFAIEEDRGPGRLVHVVDGRVELLDETTDSYPSRITCNDGSLVALLWDEGVALTVEIDGGSPTWSESEVPGLDAHSREIGTRFGIAGIQLESDVAVWAGNRGDVELWQLRAGQWAECDVAVRATELRTSLATFGCTVIFFDNDAEVLGVI